MGYVRKEDVVKMVKRWDLDGRVASDAVDEVLSMTEETVRSDASGEWIELGYICRDTLSMLLGKWYQCSVCGGMQTYGKPRFCPECGAHMHGVREAAS